MPYTRLRGNLAREMDRVYEDHAPINVKTLEETSYLLRSPKNARRLLESLAEPEVGRGTAREIAE